jgi:hypothetical protein
MIAGIEGAPPIVGLKCRIGFHAAVHPGHPGKIKIGKGFFVKHQFFF